MTWINTSPARLSITCIPMALLVAANVGCTPTNANTKSTTSSSARSTAAPTDQEMMIEDIAVSREIHVNQMGGTVVAGMPLDALQLPPNAPAARMEMDANAPYLGVTVERVSAQTAAQLPIPLGTGLVVTSVEPGSPAATAGLMTLDVVARIGDQMLVNAQQFEVMVRSHRPTETVALTVFRAGKEQKISPTLTAREMPKLAQGAPRGMIVAGTGPINGVPPGGLMTGDKDVIFMASPNALPGNGPAPRVMRFRGKPGAATSNTQTTTSSMIYNDDDARIEWTETNGKVSITVVDLSTGKTVWTGNAKPTDAERATLRAPVRKALETLVEQQETLPKPAALVPATPIND